MKTLLLAPVCFAALGLLAERANANTISVANPTVTPDSGNYIWSYAASHTNGRILADEGLITIYDFSGYIPGTEFAPAGWEFSSANLGVTPSDLMLVQADADDPTLPNLTWIYSGAEISDSPDSLTSLGLFGAASLGNLAELDSYVTRDRTLPSAGAQNGQVSGSFGRVDVPVFRLIREVPEAGSTLSLLALGIGALAFRTRK